MPLFEEEGDNPEEEILSPTLTKPDFFNGNTRVAKLDK